MTLHGCGSSRSAIIRVQLNHPISRRLPSLSCVSRVSFVRWAQIRIVAAPDAREAYGRFPCDRHSDRSDLEEAFGDSVDFGMCPAKVSGLSMHNRELITSIAAPNTRIYSSRDAKGALGCYWPRKKRECLRAQRRTDGAL